MKHAMNVAAAAMLAAVLGGCEGSPFAMNPTGGTNYGDEEFTIILLNFYGADHVGRAEKIRAEAQKETGWRNLRVINKEGSSDLTWGQYRTIDAAATDLKKAKAFKNSYGQQAFAQAIVLPLPGGKFGPPEWDLAGVATGEYTLNIAVFFDVPEAKYFGRKRHAVDYVRQLRGQGYEAYYFHEAVRSAVCVGIFGQQAVSRKPPDPHQPAAVASIDAFLITDARLQDLKNKFPKFAVNGREDSHMGWDSTTNQWRKIATESYVIKIPRKNAERREQGAASERPIQ